MIKRLMIVIVGLFLAPSMVFANGLLDGLDNYYGLNENGYNYIDSNGNYDISSGNAPTQDNSNFIFTASQTFDGSSDFLTTSFAPEGYGYSVNVWIYPTFITGSYGGNFDAIYSSSGLQTWLGVEQDGRIRYHQGGGSYQQDTATNLLSNNQWYMITLTSDGATGVNLYVDGSLVSTSGSSQPYTTGLDLTIGKYSTGNFWTGNLDEFATYNKVLTASEVSALYNSGSGLPYSNFTASPYNVSNINNNINRYYAMEQGSGDLTDSTGNQNGVATGITYQVGGIIDFGINFDGTNIDKVDMGNDAYPSSSNSVVSTCQWVYPSGSKSWQNVWRAQEGTGTNVALQRTGDSSGTYSDTWRYTWYSGSTKFDAVGGSVTTGAWTHICTTNDGTTAKLYQDGTQVASSSITAHSISGTWNTAPTLGIRPDVNTERLNANLDEVSFFDGYALTQADINFLYAAGAPDSNQQYVFSTAAPNTNPTITSVVDQVMFEDTTLDVPAAFTIGDAEDAISDLVLSYTSSNTTILNSATSITFNVNTTSGVVDMLGITPNANAFGNVNVTIVVTDTGSLTNSTTFQLNVNPVNDAPTISAIADLDTLRGATNVINFSVADIDDAFSDLDYDLTYSTQLNPAFNRLTDFSFYNGANQTLTLTASSIYYGSNNYMVNVSDDEGAFATANFTYAVYCPSSVLSTPVSDVYPMNNTCWEQDFISNIDTDIYTYEWEDFAQSVDSVNVKAYKTTGNQYAFISEQTSTANAGNITFDLSVTHPNDNLAFEVYVYDSNRTFSGSNNYYYKVYKVNQEPDFASQFDTKSGLMYGTLLLLLFITIGVASQSATLTIVFSMVGLFIGSKLVLKVDNSYLWIAGVIGLAIIWLISKLRVD